MYKNSADKKAGGLKGNTARKTSAANKGKKSLEESPADRKRAGSVAGQSQSAQQNKKVTFD